MSGSILIPAAGWEESAFFTCAFSDLILRILMGRSLRLFFPALRFGAEAGATGGLVAAPSMSSDSNCTPSTWTRSS